MGASIDDLQGLARESSEVAGRRGDAAFTVVADLHPIPRARDAVPIHHRR